MSDDRSPNEHMNEQIRRAAGHLPAAEPTAEGEASDPPKPAPGSFGGGARQSVPHEPDMNELLREALHSRQERRGW